VVVTYCDADISVAAGAGVGTVGAEVPATIDVDTFDGTGAVDCARAGAGVERDRGLGNGAAADGMKDVGAG
jgi:hypothetical protein